MSIVAPILQDIVVFQVKRELRKQTKQKTIDIFKNKKHIKIFILYCCSLVYGFHYTISSLGAVIFLCIEFNSRKQQEWERYVLL